MTVYTRKMTIKQRFKRFIHMRYVKVLSYAGKGGTGKTLGATNMAIRFAREGYKVGLCDIDLEMSSTARTMGMRGKHVERDEDKKLLKPEKHKDYPNLKMFTLSLMPFFTDEDGETIFWGGENQRDYVFQLLYEVDWGNLDIMIFDLPAGIADSIIALTNIYKKVEFAFVTGLNNHTSTDGIKKAISTCKDNKIEVLGAIANEGFYSCPHCNGISYPKGKGLVKKECKKIGIKFLGSIPLSEDICNGMANGNPYFESETYDRLFHEILSKSPKLFGKYKGRTI